VCARARACWGGESASVRLFVLTIFWSAGCGHKCLLRKYFCLGSEPFSDFPFFVLNTKNQDAQEQNSGREGAIQQQTDETNTNSNLWFHRLSVLIQSIFPGSRTIPVSTASSGGGGVVAIAVEIQGESEQHSLWSGRIHNNHSIQQPCHSNEEERQQLELQRSLKAAR